MRYTAVPELESTMKTMGWWGEAGINAANVAMSATETLPIHVFWALTQ